MRSIENGFSEESFEFVFEFIFTNVIEGAGYCGWHNILDRGVCRCVKL